MAKFIYRMQNILELKEKLEEQAKNEYVSAKANVEEEKNKLEAIALKKTEYESRLTRQVNDRLIITDIMQSRQAIKTLEVKREEQMVALIRAQKKAEIAQAQMNTAMVERKIQDKLKENSFERFKKELVEVENKENDELVSFKYNNSGKEV